MPGAGASVDEQAVMTATRAPAARVEKSLFFMNCCPSVMDAALHCSGNSKDSLLIAGTRSVKVFSLAGEFGRRDVGSGAGSLLAPA